MNWKKETILITGGSGFLGKKIIEQLDDLGCKNLRTICRRTQPQLEGKGIKVYYGDIQKKEFVDLSIAESTIVIHCAAKAGVWGRYSDYYGVNVVGTNNIISACKKNKVKYLIYTSSPSVAYDPVKNIENINEDENYPKRYLSNYSKTKKIAEENIIKSNGKTIKTVCIRPHLIWGPGDPHLLPRVIEKAKKKKLMIVGDGDNLVDLTYIDNAAHSHIKAIEALSNNSIEGGNVYYISDDNPVKLWEWINEILMSVKIRRIKKSVSYKLAYSVGKCFEIIYKLFNIKNDPPMTRFVAGQLAFSHYFDISKAKKEIAYKPIISNEEALEKTKQWISRELI